MSEVGITTIYNREIWVSSVKKDGARLTALDTRFGKLINTYLNPREIRLLVDALEPYAEKPKTAKEVFDGLALGAKFKFTDTGEEAVKTTSAHYVVLGAANGVHKDCLAADKIEEVV